MTVKTNSYGHRGTEPDKSLFDDSRAVKIFLIGDPFTFGYGIENEEHFGTLLEGKLRGIGIKNLMLNAGVGGWGSLQSFNYARDHFEEFKPDVIIYTFCGNDADDDVRFLSDKSLTNKEKGLYYFPGKIFIRDHSHLYRLVAEKMRIVIHGFALKWKIRQVSDSNVKIDKQTATLVIDDQWERIADNVRKFKSDFLKFNPNGIFILQASAPWDENIRGALSFIADGKSLFYLDIYQETAIIPDNDRKMPHDAHWSPKIHVIFADKIAGFLEEKLVHDGRYMKKKATQ
jgi:hypothetical protein